jgi:hypothetical protein
VRPPEITSPPSQAEEEACEHARPEAQLGAAAHGRKPLGGHVGDRRMHRALALGVFDANLGCIARAAREEDRRSRDRHEHLDREAQARDQHGDGHRDADRGARVERHRGGLPQADPVDGGRDHRRDDLERAAEEHLARAELDRAQRLGDAHVEHHVAGVRADREGERLEDQRALALVRAERVDQGLHAHARLGRQARRDGAEGPRAREESDAEGHDAREDRVDREHALDPDEAHSEAAADHHDGAERELADHHLHGDRRGGPRVLVRVAADVIDAPAAVAEVAPRRDRAEEARDEQRADEEARARVDPLPGEQSLPAAQVEGDLQQMHAQGERDPLPAQGGERPREPLAPAAGDHRVDVRDETDRERGLDGEWDQAPRTPGGRGGRWRPGVRLAHQAALFEGRRLRRMVSLVRGHRGAGQGQGVADGRRRHGTRP